MFDAEKLLGKLVHEVTGSDYGKYSKKKYKKRKKHKNPLISNLKSGTGLMTAIGLGIGAYEILKSKQQGQAAGSGQPYGQPAQGYGSPQAGQQMTPPPPPPPPPSQQTVDSTPPVPPVQPAAPPAAQKASHKVELSAITPAELAVRLIQTMIAAAHADGTLDEQEEKAILDRLKASEMSQEERMFLLTELHNPKPITQLADGITDPAAAQAIYMIAISAIEIDTQEERQWLDQLGDQLGLSKSVRGFIEESDT